jgi:type IV pilus assembly protein PilM
MPAVIKQRFKLPARLLPSGDRLVAVDVGSRCVKALALRRRKDHTEVRLLDAQPVAFASSRGDVTPTQITDALATLLRRLNIKNVSVISILQREFVSVKRFELPSVVRAQIEQMVPFEAEKYVPFPLERAQLGFASHPLTEGGLDAAPTAAPSSEQAKAAQAAVDSLQAGEQRSLVHLAAVRQSVIPQFLKLYDVRGVKQHAIDVSTFALYNAFMYARQQQPLDPLSGDVLLVEIGARSAEFVLVGAATGELLFSRNAPVGGDTITEYIAAHDSISFEEAEKRKCERWQETCVGSRPQALHEALEPLLDEIEKTLRYVRKAKLSDHIGCLQLSGGAAVTPGLTEACHTRCGTPADVFNPLGLFNAQTDRAPASAFSAVMGAALRMVRATRITVDLLPVDVAKLQQQALRRRRLLQLGAAAGVMLALLLSIFGVRVAWSAVTVKRLIEEKRELTPLERSVDVLESEYRLLSNSVNQMEQIIETKTSWSSVLQTLADCINSNTWVKQITVSTRQRRNNLRLTARATTLTDYIAFKDAVSKSTRFENLTAANATKQPDNSWEFDIVCDVLPDYKYHERLNQRKTEVLKRLEQDRTAAATAATARAVAPSAAEPPPVPGLTNAARTMLVPSATTASTNVPPRTLPSRRGGVLTNRPPAAPSVTQPPATP